jgi:AcrR family transcriptional regulator
MSHRLDAGHMTSPGHVGPDRRVRRTQRLLRTSLEDLLEERGWEAIRVQDLCKHAGVSRSAFYSHYGDKEDLLLDLLDALRRSLLHRGGDQPRGSASVILVEAAFEHAASHRALARSILRTTARESVRAMVFDEVLRLLPPLPHGPSQNAAAAYLAAAFMGQLLWFVTAPPAVTAREMGCLFAAMTAGAINALAGATASSRVATSPT